MKFQITKILMLFATMLIFAQQADAAGSISGPGWYYQRLPVGAVGTYENIFLQGAYADETTCEQTRWNDYDPSDGFKPWDGGPGCHYIYENEVDIVNELYSVAFDNGTIIGLPADQLHEFMQGLSEINEAHGIRDYNIKVNRLKDRYSSPQRK